MSMLLSCCCVGDLPLNNCFGCSRKPNVTSWRVNASDIQWNIPETKTNEESRSHDIGGEYPVIQEIWYKQWHASPAGLLNNLLLLTEPDTSGPCVWWHRKLANVYSTTSQLFWQVVDGIAQIEQPSAEVLAGPTLLTYPELTLPTPPACPTSPIPGRVGCDDWQYGWTVRLSLSAVTGVATLRITSNQFFLYTSYSSQYSAAAEQTLPYTLSEPQFGNSVSNDTAVASWSKADINPFDAPTGSILTRPTLQYSGPFDCSKLTRQGQYIGAITLSVASIVDPDSHLTNYPSTVTLTTA